MTLSARTSGRKVMAGDNSNTKEEPLLAPGITPDTSGKSNSAPLIFQQLQSTDIAPQPKPEPSVANRKPKPEPRLKITSAKKVIVLDSDEEPLPIGEEQPLGGDGIQEREPNMKSALGNFLRVISNSAKDEESCSSLIQTANEKYAQATRKENDGLENVFQNATAQPAFETDLPSAWFAGSSKDCPRGGGVVEERSEPSEDNARAREQKRRKLWRKKYWRIDPRRNLSSARRIQRQCEEPAQTASDVANEENPVLVNHVSNRDGDDSDVNPDDLELNPRHHQKRTSFAMQQRAAKERDIRAQRRAAEAEGGDVHWSLMVDRKPEIKEHRKEVTIKIRESHGKMEYTFVKPRHEEFRDLREELELVTRLPSEVKFELEYKNHVIKDTDTPRSLGILYTARVRARRRAKPDSDFTDEVTEVERKKRRENLLRVTVQDEKGKKHTFHHDTKTKFSSLFHAFAKMCKNDVRTYRFFYEGKRLSYDDRPIDYEDFEDGDLIDAYFETTGGGFEVMHASPVWFVHKHA